MREFLFSYRFGENRHSTSVFADSEAEALEKIKAQSWARYDGEVMARIPARLSMFGLVPRLIVWWKTKIVLCWKRD